MLSEEEITDSINTAKKFEYYKIFRTFGFFLLFFGMNYLIIFLIYFSNLISNNFPGLGLLIGNLTLINIAGNTISLYILMIWFLLIIAIPAYIIFFIYVLNKENLKLKKLEVKNGELLVHKHNWSLIELYIFFIFTACGNFFIQGLIITAFLDSNFYYLIDLISLPILNIILISFLFLIMNKILKKNYESDYKPLFNYAVVLFLISIFFEISVMVFFLPGLLQQNGPSELPFALFKSFIFLGYFKYVVSTIIFLLLGFFLIRNAKKILNS